MNVLLSTSIFGLVSATFVYEIVVAVSDVSSNTFLASASMF